MMTYLNSRQIRILKYLLHTQEPLSIRQLASDLVLPVRVVRYNLSYVEKWLEAEDIHFQLKKRDGLELRISDWEKDLLLKKLDSIPEILTIFSTEDRIEVITYELLQEPDWHQGASFQEELSVARSTITRDLYQVEEWMQTKGLELVRQPRMGIAVKGKIKDIRHVLISHLFEMDLESELLNYSIWGKTTSGAELNQMTEGKLNVITKLREWKIPDAWRNVSRILKDLNIVLSDSIVLYLALYWALMMKHAKGGFLIEAYPEKKENLLNTPEFKAVKAAIDRIQHTSGYLLPQEEAIQFTLELFGSFRGGKIRLDLFNSKRSGNDLITGISKLLLKKVGEKVGLDLSNEEVQKRLSDHLSRQFFRMELHLPLRTKLSEEIQFAYPTLWEATIDSIIEINADEGQKYEFHIPMAEANYLTMYMAMALEMNAKTKDDTPKVIVVCPSGGITVWMMVSRLKTEFPNVNIVDVVSLKKLSQVDKSSSKAIITTVNIFDRELPVIKVSPILTDEDVRAIRKILYPDWLD